jgi:hypothetical protein
MTTNAQARGALLGILTAGPTSAAHGQVVVANSIPGVQIEPVRTETAMMMHLGYYVKAREIVVAVDHARAKLLERLGK